MRVPSGDMTGVEQWLELLDDHERDQSRRFALSRHRDVYVAAHALLRVTLSSVAPLLPCRWRFAGDLRGKPMIAPGLTASDLRFSLSHATGCVACAVSTSLEVGIDVEDCTRPERKWRAAEVFLPDPEAQALSVLSGDARRERFFLLWTLHEALAKASGRGLAFALEHAEFARDPVCVRFDDAVSFYDATRWHFESLRLSPDHLLSLAIHNPKKLSLEIDAQEVQRVDLAA
jgi:4'-phosphopantetheinyl transferase